MSVIIMTLTPSDWFVSQSSSAMSDCNHLNYPNLSYRVTLQPGHLVALLLLHEVGDLLQDVVALLLRHGVALGLLHQLELQVTGDPGDLAALLPGHLLVVHLRDLVALLGHDRPTARRGGELLVREAGRRGDDLGGGHQGGVGQDQLSLGPPWGEGGAVGGRRRRRRCWRNWGEDGDWEDDRFGDGHLVVLLADVLHDALALRDEPRVGDQAASQFEYQEIRNQESLTQSPGSTRCEAAPGRPPWGAGPG